MADIDAAWVLAGLDDVVGLLVETVQRRNSGDHRVALHFQHALAGGHKQLVGSLAALGLQGKQGPSLRRTMQGHG